MLLLALLACDPNDDIKVGECDEATTCDGHDVLACGEVAETCGAEDVCVGGGGCVTCLATFSEDTLSLVADSGDGSLAFAYRQPVTVDLEGEAGTLSLTTTAGLEVTDADGAAVTSLDIAALPQTVFLRATRAGGGRLTASVSDGATPCAENATLSTVAVAASPITGRPRAAAPGWETARSFLPGEAMYAMVDPVHQAALVGATVDLYVVAHREAAAWAADPALVDVTGTVEAATVAATGLTMVQVWETPEADDVDTAYDVVIDVDRDGTLTAGDRFVGPEGDVVSVFTDLTAAGPHAVESADYDGGFMQDKRMYWPADLASMGPRPLIVISHGNGHQYDWYDYLGEHLASWGYIVMSHENNTQPGIETASSTTLSNTAQFLAGLDTLADGAMAGLVDNTRIGWIGHSRGGEGVVRAYDRLVDGDVDAPTEYDLESIRFISSIAPTVFNEVTDSDPHDRPYYLLAGTADGDVTGSIDCQQCQFFRIWEQGTGPKMSSYVVGASHNDFNCCGYLEGQGPDMIGRDAAQVVAKGYYLALARGYLDEDDAALDVFRRMYDGFHPDSFGAGVEVASLFRDAHVYGYPIIDDFQSESDEAVSSSGGAVVVEGDVLREGLLRDADYVYSWRASDPMNGMTHAVTSVDTAAGLSLTFADGAGSVRFEVPTDLADVSSLGVLSFEVAQLSCHEYTVANAPFGFTVALQDAAGVRAEVDFSDQGLVPLPYPRANCGGGGGQGWADELVTVRIPLTDFTLGSALDLSQVALIDLDFGVGPQSGAVAVDNVEFSR